MKRVVILFLVTLSCCPEVGFSMLWKGGRQSKNVIDARGQHFPSPAEETLYPVLERFELRQRKLLFVLKRAEGSMPPFECEVLAKEKIQLSKAKLKVDGDEYKTTLGLVRQMPQQVNYSPLNLKGVDACSGGLRAVRIKFWDTIFGVDSVQEQFAKKTNAILADLKDPYAKLLDFYEKNRGKSGDYCFVAVDQVTDIVLGFVQAADELNQTIEKTTNLISEQDASLAKVMENSGCGVATNPVEKIGAPTRIVIPPIQKFPRKK